MKMHRLRDSAAVVPRVVVLPCYASKIVQLPIHSLRPYANNGRTHSKRQIKQIFESIKRFGFVNPVLIDESKTGRQARTIEIDPHYCDVAIRRWPGGRGKRR